MSGNRGRGNRGRFLAGATALALVFCIMFALPSVGPAAAQTPTLSTPYPTIAVEPGDRVTLDLHVTADAPTPVALRLTELPEGWDASLRGGGFLVGGVYAVPDEPPELELEVDVPPDAAEGTYTLAVEAEGNDGVDVLEFAFRLDATPAGETTLTAEFPSLRAAAGNTFSFDLVLDNANPQERTFALGAGGPQGWQVEVAPAGEDAASTVTLGPGESTDLEVEAVPPPGVTADTYPILVRATGDDTVELELEAEVIGTYELAVTSPDERLDVTANAGRPATFTVVVRNDGSATLTDVELDATSPSGWETAFSPETIDVIEPGASARAELTITPAEDAIIGDYRLTVTALAPEVADEIDVRVSLESSRAWGLVGIGLVVAALGGLGWVFRTFGRR